MRGILAVLSGVALALLASGGRLTEFPFASSSRASVPSADTLIGLWGVEEIVTPPLGGLLTIDESAPMPVATVGNFSVAVRSSGDTVRLVLPEGLGEFRGRREDAKTIRGHWIQPPGPGPYYQQRASPVVLTETRPRVYQGTVDPLEHRISFYISIARDPAGGLTAFIKNPEANFFAGRRYEVTLDRDSVHFVHPDVPEEGTYHRASDRMLLPLLFGYGPLTFTRRTGRDAAGFYPRATAGPYRYEPPHARDDGWITGTLAEAGIDQEAIGRFIGMILSAENTPENPLNIQSLLIARHGKLVLEEYFYGFERDRTHDMRSASKTVASVLVGVARDRGEPINENTPVYSLFPGLKPFANWDERKSRMRVADLMNMMSGLAIDDSDPGSPGNEGTLGNQESDWHKYTLDLPMVREAGELPPVYGSANTNLVGGALRNATGRWLPELFDDYFARPLQITAYTMNLMPDSEGYAGGGLYLKPRDQLKLGQLYLDGGEWNGRQVVSREWVDLSLIRRGDMKPRMETDTAHGYGYTWHFRNTWYWAGGNGGQLIIVIPEHDMVVGFTGGDYTEFRKYMRWEIEFLPKYVLSAVLDSN